MTRLTSTLPEAQYTFLIISRSVFLRMRDISNKSRRENHDTQVMFSSVFRKSCCLWDNL